MPSRPIDGIANLCAQFHHRLVHLGLDLLFENDFSAFENFVNVRPQLARFRIDDGELLFDAEGKRVILCAHRGGQISARNSALSSRVAKTTRDLTHGVMTTQISLRDISRFVRSLASLGMTRGGDCDLTQDRLMSASSPRLEEICPSSSCRGRERVRVLYGSPFLKRLRQPIQNLPGRPRQLLHQAPGYKSLLPPARRRARRTPPCLDRTPGIDSTAERPPQLSAGSPLAFATRFDIANDKDGAAHMA